MSHAGLPAIGWVVILFLGGCGGGDSGTPAPTVNIGISPHSVPAGQPATLTWSSTNASNCAAMGAEWAGPQPASGSLPQKLSTPGTYTYTLSCTSSSGASASGSASLTVTPQPAPTVTLHIAPTSVAAYQTATVTWSSTNASTCVAKGDEWAGPASPSGSLPQTLSTPGTYAYTLSCSSSSGAGASASASLTVTPAPPAITGALSNGVIGVAYNETIQVTGGIAPFSWTVSGGALPHNLSLCPSTNAVTVCGTPDTVAQAVSFTIQVTDSAHHTASQAFTVSILLQADSMVLSPVSLDFGDQILGRQSSALTETLTNTATSAMLITSVTISGSNAAEFNKTSTTCGASLAAGASCVVHVTFTPGQPGPRAAALTINDDTASSPQSVPLNGVGLTASPNATLSVAGVTFGTQLVGTTSPAMLVVLTNNGALALNVGDIAASSGFAETSNCLPSLASRAACIISVTFTPGSSGPENGTLSISDDATGSPQTVSLSGTGSTITPLLTGACFACRSVTSSQCPAGAPSKTPAEVASQCGQCSPVFGCGQVTVDHARSCSIPGPPYHGYCEAQ